MYRENRSAHEAVGHASAQSQRSPPVYDCKVGGTHARQPPCRAGVSLKAGATSPYFKSRISTETEVTNVAAESSKMVNLFKVPPSFQPAGIGRYNPVA